MTKSWIHTRREEPSTVQRQAEKIFHDVEDLRVRKLFDAYGLYSRQDLFALTDGDRVFVRVDDALRNELEAEGGEVFSWTNPETDQTLDLSFMSLPGARSEDCEVFRQTAFRGLEIARHSRREKIKSPRRFSI